MESEDSKLHLQIKNNFLAKKNNPRIKIAAMLKREFSGTGGICGAAEQTRTL